MSATVAGASPLDELKRWIDDHADLRHHLARSGMIGSLDTVPPIFAHPRRGDVGELRRRLGERVGVAPKRLFLTHGATEGNAIALHYLARKYRRRRSRAPTYRVDRPEYPQFSEVAEVAGFRRAPARSPADIALASDPNNPTGRGSDRARRRDRFADIRSGVIDETFRELSAHPSAAADLPGFFLTGTFTKSYGADAVRVGWVVSPEAEQESFARYHGLLADEIAPHSVDVAESLLDHHDEVLGEARGIFRRNEVALRRSLGVGNLLDAPVWFDRTPDGDALAQTAANSGVLVCPGRYFGVRQGVRLCLTRRSFPVDLEAYVRVRRAVLDGS